MRPKTVGLIAHTGKTGAADLTRAVAEEFARKSVNVLVEEATANIARLVSAGSAAKIAQASELLVVLGGDGTLLNAVAQCGTAGKKFFGINIGSLGFLNCANSSGYGEAIEAIADGRIRYSERVLLEVRLLIGEKVVSKADGLNDAVISRGDLSRLIRLWTRINGEPLTEFNADGLIIATPTGSTAYNLSAGGPIIYPTMGAVVLTPICPHMLTNRPLVLPDSLRIEIGIATPNQEIFLTLDGQEGLPIAERDTVCITKSPNPVTLIRTPNKSYFDVLRTKLKLGEG